MKVAYYTLRCFEDNSIVLANTLAKSTDLLLIMSYYQNVKGRHLPNDSIQSIDANVRKRIFERKGRFRYPRQLFYDGLVVYWIVRHWPHVVFVEGMESPYFFIFYPLFKLLGIHFAYAIHDVEPHSGVNHRVTELLNKITVRFADKIVVFSQNQNDLLKCKYKKEGVVIRLHYDYDQFGKYCDEHPIQRERNTILFLGTIRPNKGLEILIKAAELARVSIPTLKVIIAGACEDFSFYRQFMATPDMYELHLGWIETNDIGGYFLRSQLSVLPYHDATQSGPLLMSLGFNCPVIVSSVGGLPEYVSPGETGCIFAKDDYAQLARLVVNLLADKPLLKRMQRDSRNWVIKNFSVDATAKCLYDTFEAMV